MCCYCAKGENVFFSVVVNICFSLFPLWSKLPGCKSDFYGSLTFIVKKKMLTRYDKSMIYLKNANYYYIQTTF